MRCRVSPMSGSVTTQSVKVPAVSVPIMKAMNGALSGSIGDGVPGFKDMYSSRTSPVSRGPGSAEG